MGSRRESPSGEKRTPGRSTPLDLNTTEDHHGYLVRGGYERTLSAYALARASVKGLAACGG